MSKVKSRPPLRLIMFSSESCKFCPQIETILKSLIKTYYYKSVSLTTVDVDISPETAMQFGIKNLPTVVMGTGTTTKTGGKNYERLIEGYMESEDIKDRLMNRIFHSILAGDTALAKRKENLIWLTRNIVNSVQKKLLIRPNIGDYVHLQALQITNMSLLALDPIASTLLYESGKVYGLYGPGQLLLFQINKKMGEQIKLIPKFYELIKTLKLLYDDDFFPIHIAESAEILENKDLEATIRIYGSAYAVGAPNMGETLCHSLAGELAGLIQAVMARFVRVEETTCWGTGTPYCEFKIKVVDEEVPINPVILNESGKKEVQKRRNKFITTLAEMTEIHQASLMYKEELRKNGDYVHIGVIQQAFTALKIIDPFCGMLLYSAGVTFGLTADKRIINSSLQGKSIPISFYDAINILVKELQHPTTLLTRQHSFVSLETIESEKEEPYYVISLQELCFSAGATNVGETFCDFIAGFMNGRLQLMVEEELMVQEIECFGTGSELCKFKISIE